MQAMFQVVTESPVQNAQAINLPMFINAKTVQLAMFQVTAEPLVRNVITIKLL
jgi:hypothetical protein